MFRYGNGEPGMGKIPDWHPRYVHVQENNKYEVLSMSSLYFGPKNFILCKKYRAVYRLKAFNYNKISLFLWLSQKRLIF
jgi:hypothetical protein